MAQLIQDLRSSARRLLREPVFTITVLLVLVLGLAGGTVLFSLLRTVVLRPLPYADPEHLALVWETYPPGGYDQLLISGPDYRDLAEGNRSFEALAAFRVFEVTHTGDGAPELLDAVAVTPELFPVLRARPALGRVLSKEGDDTAVVLSSSLWRDRFGSDPDILGHRIQLSGETYTVIGVMDRALRFPPPLALGARTYGTGEGVDLFLPMPRDWLDGDRGRRKLMVLGRLLPGVTAVQASRELEARAATLSEVYPESNPEGLSAYAVPLHEQSVAQVRPTLALGLASVGLIVLIACANVANLLLARAAGRRQEMAVRAALGADSRRLGRQLLTESLVLGLTGGLVGIGIAGVAIRLLSRQSLDGLPRLADLRLDLPTLAFALGLSVITSLLFGVLPTWRSSRPDLIPDLRATRGDSLGRGGSRLLRRFVIAQLALSLTLLAAAGLTARSFWSSLHTDLGFEARDTVVVSIAVPGHRYPSSSDRQQLRDRLLPRIEGLPGVAAAGAANSLPLSALLDGIRYSAQGKPDDDPAQRPVAVLQEVTPGYFPALGLRLHRGRWLEPEDETTATETPAILVNRTLADRTWPGRDPVGRQLRLKRGAGPESAEAWHTVVGVVEDVRLRGVHAPAEAAIYRSLGADGAHGGGGSGRLLLVVRPQAGAGDLPSALRSVIWTLDPDLPVETTTLRERLLRALSQPRLGAVLLALLATVAVLLAAAGTWGMVSYTVVQRQRELGIRMAFGASRRQILRLVLRSGLRLAAFGSALGLLGALGAGRLLAGTLPGLPSFDPGIFAVAALLLSAIALGAVYLPARRLVPRDPAALLDSQ